MVHYYIIGNILVIFLKIIFFTTSQYISHCNKYETLEIACEIHPILNITLVLVIYKS